MKVYGLSLLFCLSMLVNAQTEDAFAGSSDSGFCIGKENVIIAKIENDFFATVFYFGQDKLPHTKGILIKQEQREHKQLQLLYECLKDEADFEDVIDIQRADSKNSFVVKWNSEPGYKKLAVVTYANSCFTKQPFVVEGLDAILTKGKAVYARNSAPSWGNSREMKENPNEWKTLPSGLSSAQMDEIAKNLATNLGKNSPNAIVEIEVISPDSLVATCADHKRILFSKSGNDWVLKEDEAIRVHISHCWDGDGAVSGDESTVEKEGEPRP